MTLALIAWNAGLYPEDRQQELVDKVLGPTLSAFPDDMQTEVRAFINTLIEREKTVFATNRRTIVAFELEDRGTDFHLSVASTLDEVPLS